MLINYNCIEIIVSFWGRDRWSNGNTISIWCDQ